MRLLYVSPNAELGGAEKILETFIKYHDQKEFEVFVVFLREGSLEKKWRELGAQVLKIPPNILQRRIANCVRLAYKGNRYRQVQTIGTF